MLKRFYRWWRSLKYYHYYIIADSNDNSITFSLKLYKHIERASHSEDEAKVFMFEIPAFDTYGFMINPKLERKTQLSDIQFNEKYKTIGFEALCPTVNRMFVKYGLPFGAKVKLTVTVCKLSDGKIFYNIERLGHDSK